jgi:iron complex transport system substrate-binding protein
MVCAMGMGDLLCGISHECDFPDHVKALPQVTRCLIPHGATSGEIDAFVRQQSEMKKGLYALQTDLLAELQPDLILTQSLCGVCAIADDDVRAVAEALPCRPTVLNLQPDSLSAVIESLRTLGEATDRAREADAVIAKLQQRIETVRSRSINAAKDQSGNQRPLRVMVLEWIDPPFTAGHWTPELVSIAGGIEVLGRNGQTSQTTNWQAIRDADPELMLIACCGMSVDRTCQELPLLKPDVELHPMSCVRNRRVYVVDGNRFFSRPGPRLVDSLEILAHAIDDQTHPLPANLQEHAAIAVDLIGKG